MYQLSDKQIDHILNDISARGVEMESLQQNLLDHVCCIIEQDLEENGDFESFYQKTIKTFYKDALWEIEEETLLLLTYKNYYAMKKTMIISGMYSAAAFILGSFFKIMHWPGASFLILTAMVISSLIFLPIYFLFRTKETPERKNKIILAVGTINGVLFCVSSLFKIMHWPGAHLLWLATIGMMTLLFIPLFFFNGIKKPETKTNTIATTIILIIVAGFFFALTNLKSSKQVYISKMYNYLQNEELISRMQSTHHNDSTPQSTELSKLSDNIQSTCNKIKEMVIQTSIGQTTLPKDFESKNLWIEEGSIGDEFRPEQPGHDLILVLVDQIKNYNTLIGKNDCQIPIEHTLLKMTGNQLFLHSNYNLLSHVSQIQLFVLANER
jgi:hypothetical protein